MTCKLKPSKWQPERGRIAALAVLAVSTCACSSTGYWLTHARELRLSTVQYTTEPIFDSLRSPDEPHAGYQIQILVQNDGPRGIKFSKYESGSWTGAGLRAQMTFRPEVPVGDAKVDYSRLSGLTVWPGDDAHTGSPIIAWIFPKSETFAPDELRSIAAAIDVQFSIHDKEGNVVAPPITAQISTELLLIGKIAPRRSSATAR